MNDFWTALAAVVAALSASGIAYTVGIAVGYRRAKQKFANDRESKRFSEVYAPLYGFFTTCHITTVSSRGAPYLRQRIRNAVSVFQDERNLKKVLNALFDQQDLGTSGEVEYGSDFPLSEITAHIRGREQYADQALLNFIGRANRSQYDDIPNDRMLTDADLRLFDHICVEYKKLAQQFSTI